MTGDETLVPNIANIANISRIFEYIANIGYYRWRWGGNVLLLVVSCSHKGRLQNPRALAYHALTLDGFIEKRPSLPRGQILAAKLDQLFRRHLPRGLKFTPGVLRQFRGGEPFRPVPPPPASRGVGIRDVVNSLYELRWAEVYRNAGMCVLWIPLESGGGECRGNPPLLRAFFSPINPSKEGLCPVAPPKGVLKKTRRRGESLGQDQHLLP